MTFSGTTTCQQLHGMLCSQKRKLEEAEGRVARDEEDISKIRLAIKNTEKKLADEGC